MPAKPDGGPVVDIASVAASPALIMLMVGSLVWFLVDVLSPSSHPDRLLWCLSFFVFGAVLISRITIELGYGYAAMYAAALGGVTFLATIVYVEYPNRALEKVGWALNFALMALIWWLTDRLTWDCTHLDEDRRTSGRGLLAAAGWDDMTTPEATDDGEPPERAARRRKKDATGLMGWLERYHRHREARKKRPHTPGTWVLYFGLAALPVFALGQSLIPAEDVDRRRATLMEAAIFVGSGLGLLATTSLMGLRRFLRERGAKVPLPMALGWLGLAAGLIGCFVLAAALLPRPYSEAAWVDLGGKPAGNQRSASRNATLRDNSAGKGEGATGTKGERSEEGRPTNAGPRGQGGENRQGSDQGQTAQGKSGAAKSNPSGGNSGEKSGDSSQGERGERGRGDGSDRKQTQRGQSGSDSGGDRSGADSQSEDRKGDLGGGPSVAERLGGALDAVSSILKWVVWAVVALVMVGAVVYFILNGLAPFTDWARRLLDWFRALFARGSTEEETESTEARAVAGPRRVPFSAFSNPFADGTARRRTAAELAVYTLAALDAWAGDRGAGRRPGETPTEFAERIGEEFTGIDPASRRVAELAVRALYSTTPMPPDTPKALASVWRQLEQSAVPLAAR